MSDPDAKEETGAPKSAEYTDETILWEGKPSQIVNLPTFLWWGGISIAILIFKSMWDDGMATQYPPIVDLIISWSTTGVQVVAVTSMLYAYLAIRYTHTTITHNKIKEVRGITKIFRQELFCEISDVKDVKSPPAGLLALFGLASIVMETSDNDQPTIKIRAIRNRNLVVEQFLPVWRELKVERRGYFSD
ncbi:hypothetical protein [Zhongshania sp. BJYM1]|uniref:hypothetical protein n=1 Tax=Zhongshania aquatica TaxID=2965069 RepID=UPI0022B2C4AA|nr:hypothetical protein [Marortus sp. BJYM1]